jgi:hypothetical protein
MPPHIKVEVLTVEGDDSSNLEALDIVNQLPVNTPHPATEVETFITEQNSLSHTAETAIDATKASENEATTPAIEVTVSDVEASLVDASLTDVRTPLSRYTSRNTYFHIKDVHDLFTLPEVRLTAHCPANYAELCLARLRFLLLTRYP